MKLVFMGTPDFAVPSLKELIARYEVAAVFTQPDKPKGRGQKLQFTPVKEIAVNNNIPVFQPVKLRNDTDSIKVLKDIKPDLIIVIAYGQLLPQDILEIPRLGCINLHASLLPKLRGAAPINWAIINGDKKTGNTTMLMSRGLDTGDMLLKSETEIGDVETAGELHDRLSILGVDLLINTIEGLDNKCIIPEKQNDQLSSYAPMLNKELGHINYDEEAYRIYSLIRGVSPWPGAFSFYNNNMIKICRAKIGPYNKYYDNVGEIIELSKDGIEISCRLGSIIITELQEVGGKRMDAGSYLNGHNLNKGDKLK